LIVSHCTRAGRGRRTAVLGMVIRRSGVLVHLRHPVGVNRDGNERGGSGRGCWISACGANVFQKSFGNGGWRDGERGIEDGDGDCELFCRATICMQVDAWPQTDASQRGSSPKKTWRKRPWRRAGRCMARSKLFHHQQGSTFNRRDTSMNSLRCHFFGTKKPLQLTWSPYRGIYSRTSLKLSLYSQCPQRHDPI
jgi:hypothetical protein